MFLLIFRYIKKCYKRSIVIVFCFFLSFMTIWTNGILKQTANRVELNSLKKDSIYHLKFNNLSSDGVRYLKNHQRVERSEEHTSELQSRQYLVCRLLLEKKRSIDSPS